MDDKLATEVEGPSISRTGATKILQLPQGSLQEYAVEIEDMAQADGYKGEG